MMPKSPPPRRPGSRGSFPAGRDPAGARGTAAGRRAASARSSSSLPWILGIALVVVVGVVAILATRGGDDDGGSSGTEVAAVEVDGSALPRLPDSGADPGVGQPVPALTGVTPTGEPITVGGTGDGTPKAIVVVAHWCPHCQAEVPRIVEWMEDGGLPEGVAIEAVSTAVDSSRPNHPPSEWLDDEGWTVPTMVDSEDATASGALGVSAFPFFVFVDGDGNLVGRTSGEIAMPQLQSTLEQLAAMG